MWFCQLRVADVEQDSDKVVSTAGLSPTILPHSEDTLKSLSEATWTANVGISETKQPRSKQP